MKQCDYVTEKLANLAHLHRVPTACCNCSGKCCIVFCRKFNTSLLFFSGEKNYMV